MQTTELVSLLDATFVLLETHTDELRDLDAALGDGDLGITIGAGSRAARAALADLDPAALPSDVLKVVGGAFAKANPSTMGALVGGALLSAARGLGATTDVDRTAALAIGRAAAESIALRGKSAVGDKTILDALVPALDAMDAAADDVLAVGIAAARTGVEDTRALQSQRGRASWLGERSMGLQDPGATAFWRFLESLARAR